MNLIPKKWTDFQHYKNRCPPWIKIHRELLSDRDFMCLPLASKAMAPLLWLLASESKSGEFDASIDELAFRLRLTVDEVTSGLRPLIDKGFFLDASNMLAPCVQDAIPETETEGEEREAKASLSPAKLPTCPTQSVIDVYHAELPELPSIKILSDSRKKAIGSFWKWVLTSKRTDGENRAKTPDDAMAWIGAYFRRAKENDFLMGRNTHAGTHANWQCDLDFLLTEKGKKHVIEKTRDMK